MKRCLNCGEEITRKQNKTYCSRACRNTHLVRRDFENIPKYPRVCKVCGKEFLAKRPNRMYCSVSCNKKAQYQRNRGKVKGSQSKIWKDKRKEVFEKQKGHCWLCGKDLGEEKFNLHHTKEGDRSIQSEAVVVLCLSCHNRIHSITAHVTNEGFITFSGAAIDLLKNKGYRR